MANLTITVDEETLKRARIRALELGTSVNALVRDYLESFAGNHQAQIDAMEHFIALGKTTGSGSGGRIWRREDLYDLPGSRE